MQAAITYVHHNCFVLELDGRTLLFDYPAAEHRPPGAEDVVRRALKGADAVIFFSHSHADHCGADILELTGDAASAAMVLSFDVPEMVPELDVTGALVVDPDETVHVGDLKVNSLESNDLGVAFMIEAPEGRIYYGGDLALWDWPGLDRAGLDFTMRYFDDCLERVRAFAPHIAFADADPRLDSRAGGGLFWERVRPPVFVPMHGFGDLDSLSRFARDLAAPAGRVLTFDAVGARREITLP